MPFTSLNFRSGLFLFTESSPVKKEALLQVDRFGSGWVALGWCQGETFTEVSVHVLGTFDCCCLAHFLLNMRPSSVLFTFGMQVLKEIMLDFLTKICFTTRQIFKSVAGFTLGWTTISELMENCDLLAKILCEVCLQKFLHLMNWVVILNDIIRVLLCTFNAIILLCGVAIENGNMKGNFCHIKVFRLCFILRPTGMSLWVLLDSNGMIQW